ncbi:MAG: hypothetical protein ACHQKY_16220, partial [Terriglobia bacterium]
MKTSSFEEVEERYASLTPEEFAAIDRAALTDEAQAAYAEEAARRGIAEQTVKIAREDQELEASKASLYAGVRGWLLLFCLALTVFGPLVTVFFLVANYQGAAQYFEQFPGLKVISLTDISLSMAMMA